MAGEAAEKRKTALEGEGAAGDLHLGCTEVDDPAGSVLHEQPSVPIDAGAPSTPLPGLPFTLTETLAHRPVNRRPAADPAAQ